MKKKKTVKVKGVTNVDTNAILDAVKELTSQIVELAKVTNSMKASHDKWVRAGKF